MPEATAQLFAAYTNSDLQRFQQALNECSQYLPRELARKLPGIIVVGDQSSGKSTVLQALSREFRPCHCYLEKLLTTLKLCRTLWDSEWRRSCKLTVLSDL